MTTGGVAVSTPRCALGAMDFGTTFADGGGQWTDTANRYSFRAGPPGAGARTRRSGGGPGLRTGPPPSR
jgi:hypothetical protein